jgi:hypothetical protein
MIDPQRTAAEPTQRFHISGEDRELGVACCCRGRRQRSFIVTAVLAGIERVVAV